MVIVLLDAFSAVTPAVRWFLHRNIDVHIYGVEGMFELHVADKFDHADFVSFLLSRGYSVPTIR